MAGLTPEEIEKLRKLLPLAPLADEIKQDAEYQKSRNIVWQHWKGLVIGFGLLVGTVAALFDQIKTALAWLFR